MRGDDRARSVHLPAGRRPVVTLLGVHLPISEED